MSKTRRIKTVGTCSILMVGALLAAMMMRPEAALARPGYEWQPGCHCSPPAAETAPETGTTSAAPTTATSADRSKPASTTLGGTGDEEPAPWAGRSAASAGVVGLTTTTTGPPSGGGGTGEPAGAGISASPSRGLAYYVSPVAIILLLVYVISVALSKGRRTRAGTQRKIWNTLLFGTFLATAVSGLILAVAMAYGVRLRLPFNMLFWHVEAGVAMSLISLFHVGSHLSYYAALLRRRHPARARRRAATTTREVPYRLAETYSAQRSSYEGGSNR